MFNTQPFSGTKHFTPKFWPALFFSKMFELFLGDRVEEEDGERIAI